MSEVLHSICGRFSPYRNGSYLLPFVHGFREEWTLYLFVWHAGAFESLELDELKLYAVSAAAHHRGFGSSEEIVRLRKTPHYSTEAPEFT